MILRVLMFLVGAVYLFGGGYMAWKAFESRNLVVTAVWACLGLSIGVYLCALAITGFTEDKPQVVPFSLKYSTANDCRIATATYLSQFQIT